jgi:hypothetical protein
VNDLATGTEAPAEVSVPPSQAALAPADLPQAPESPPAAPHASNGEAASFNSEKRHPAYKVGPLATDKDNSVEAAVWDRVIQTRDGREFTVYNVTVQANWRDSDGAWKKSSNFRGSQIYALVYCLQRCSDWILAQRDPANTCPF